jgi:hypothetical protein
MDAHTHVAVSKVPPSRWDFLLYYKVLPVELFVKRIFKMMVGAVSLDIFLAIAPVKTQITYFFRPYYAQ